MVQELLIGSNPTRAIKQAGAGAAVLVTLFSLNASAYAETAYSALRVVGIKRGEDIFKRVIEIRGEGAQEPAAWKIVVLDAKAKTGMREIEVRKGRISKDSTLKKPRGASSPIDLAMLNLDSEGVVAVINQENEGPAPAEKISYTLSNSTTTGTPVWLVELRPPRNGTIASLEIAADTGQVLTKAVLPVTGDAQFLSDGEQVAKIENGDRTVVEGSDDRMQPEGKARKQAGSPGSRERVSDVPKVVQRVVKEAVKPVRLLRRFLP